MNPPLPTIIDRKTILYHVTIFEFPHATVRHQVAEGDTLVEKVTTFETWIELEAVRIARRTGMTFGKATNKQGQVSLAALRIQH